MSKQFVKWIQKTVSAVLDPEREDRVKKLTSHLYKQLREHRQKFRLDDVVNALTERGIELSSGDILEAREKTFCRILEKVWDDGVLTAKEQETVLWVQKALHFTDDEGLKLRQRFAQQQFQHALAAAMEDGVLSEEEVTHLEHIANSVGHTVKSYTQLFFRKEGEGFVRGMFLACVEDGELTPEEWSRFTRTGSQLGLKDDEIQNLIAIPAKKYVEHVLADAKSDGFISEEEKQQLHWLVEVFRLDREFTNYLHHELRLVTALYDVSRGVLPSIVPPDHVELRAGEIVHLYGSATFVVRKNLKSGLCQEHYHGTATILDSRMIFQSTEKSEVVRYRRIISNQGGGATAHFQLEGKPLWSVHLSNEPLFYAIFSKAIAMANQTAVRTNVDGPSRHISRDVRQRVWQRYGGQCAECAATDYLEFDHIIPHAKGGSNSDNNIQLLCRKCNLKKSDHI